METVIGEILDGSCMDVHGVLVVVDRVAFVDAFGVSKALEQFQEYEDYCPGAGGGHERLELERCVIPLSR